MNLSYFFFFLGNFSEETYLQVKGSNALCPTKEQKEALLMTFDNILYSKINKIIIILLFIINIKYIISI